MSNPVRFSAAMMVLLLFPAMSLAGELAGTLAAEVPERHASDVPVLIKITIKNTGDETYRYWCGGPAIYPSAAGFKAFVTDDRGITRDLALSNGQYVQGSGGRYPIDPGATSTFPAALERLPPGTYSLVVKGEAGGWFKDGKMIVDWPAMATPAPVAFTVRDDPTASSAFERDMLKRVRTGEAFARHVVVKYPREAITSALIADLDSDDLAVASHAIDTFYDMRDVPRILPEALATMMTRHLRSDEYPRDLLLNAAVLAGKTGSDEVLDPVLALMERARDGFERRDVLRLLGPFKQAKAHAALREALRDREPEVRANAAMELARRGDAVAVEALIDPEVLKLERRYSIYSALSRFPNDDRAIMAIDAGLKHPDPHIRESATHAHRDVQARKARREQEATPVR